MSQILEATVNAYLPSYYKVGDLEGDAVAAVNKLTITDLDMHSHGYAVVGRARVEITLVSEDVLLTNKIDALRKQAADVQANATAEVTNIHRRINELLAIGHDVSVQS